MSITRKNCTLEFKESIAKSAVETLNVSLDARQHGIASELVYRWIRQFKKTNKTSKANIKSSIDNSSIKTLKTENETLKKLLGEEDLEM